MSRQDKSLGEATCQGHIFLLHSLGEGWTDCVEVVDGCRGQGEKIRTQQEGKYICHVCVHSE